MQLLLCVFYYVHMCRHYNVLDRPVYERTIFSYMSGLTVKIEDGLPFLLKAEEGI